MLLLNSTVCRKTFLLLALVLVIVSERGFAQQSSSDPTIQTIERNKTDNTPTSIFFSPATKWSEDQAQDIFQKYFGLEGADNTMVLTSTTKTKAGITAKRYYQYYKGIKVEYGTVTLTCKDGRVSFVTGNYYRTDNGYSPVAATGEKAALDNALKSVGAEKYMWQNPKEEARIKNFYHRDTSYMPVGKLVWIEDYSNGMNGDRQLHLAYKFDVYAEQPLSRDEIFVDATTGKVLFTNKLIKHTAASGHSEYSGVIPFQTSHVGGTYELYDSTRGDGVHTMNLNNGTDYTMFTEFTNASNLWPDATADTVALDAHWGAEMVYDYWNIEQGRLSWDNANGILNQFVHYSSGYNNAYWDGAEMTYGDGTGCGSGFTSLVSLDVTGHEIGHGVCQATANLVYASESGAMNEGFSDCWGATIENWANPHEVDAVPKSTWQIGEEIGCGNPLRRMDFPKLKNDPDTHGGSFWVNVVGCVPSGGNDECGVHTNSGLMNKWYFLVTAGGSGTNDIGSAYSVTGLGFTESQNILYQTELVLASTADYAACRTTSINVALTLYGPCSPEVIAVTNAWYAVGVGTAFTPCLPNIGFTAYTLNVTENAATTSCPASKTYTIGLKPYGPAFTGGNPTVNVFAAHGTAVPGVDYTLASTSLTFPVGSTATQNASITVFDNGAVHDDKNLVLGFTVTPNGSDATVSTTNDSLFININNDDSIPDLGHTEYHTLNTGTTVTSNLSSAFPGANQRAHSQFILFAGDLSAAGVKPGIPITQIAFNVTTKNSTAPFVGYTVSMLNSTFADMSSIFASGLTQVYTGNHTTNAGIDSLDFNTSNFTWDGTSNVIVEICYGKNASAFAANDLMDGIDDNPIIACDHAFSNSGSGTGCSLAYDGSGNSTARPVMRFKQIVPPTAIEQVAGSAHTWDVKAGQEVYFYNTTDGKVMTGLKNISNDLGCVTTTVSQQGIGFTPATFSPINRSFKEFTMTPTINGGITTYDAIIYLTNVELNGVAPSSLFLLKTDAPTDATVSTLNSVELTPTLITGTNYVGFKGTFTGFSRFLLVDGPICDIPPSAITPAGPTTFCIGGNVLLNANTGVGLTYQWRLAGSDIAGATNSSYTAAVGGSYTVKEFSAACNAVSAPVIVTVNSVTAGTITGGFSVCIGQNTPLSDATTGGIWTSANTSLATVGTSSGIVTGAGAGAVVITYSVTNICGTATTTATITVNAPSAVAAITGTLSACQGSTSPLSDATPAGVWSSGNTAIATVGLSGLTTGAAAGSVPISYTITNAFGCVSSAIATFTVNALPAAVITPMGSTTLCAGGGSVLLDATTGPGFTYQWKSGGVPISGATASGYTATGAGNYTVVITNSNGCSATSAVVTVTVSGIVVVPSVSISASPGTLVCVASTPVTYTATATKGGSLPVYQWSVNGTATTTGNPYIYTPANGDIISCLLTSNDPCATPDTASNSVLMTIGVKQTPVVSVSALPGSTICTGGHVTFVATPVFGGTAPTYQWTQNGTNVGTSSPTYAPLATPANGDIIGCTMTSNYICLTSPTAVSSPFMITVESPSLNLDTIKVTHSYIAAGQADTFVAIAPHGGASPAYQWMLNAATIPGATNATYITNTLVNGDKIFCQVTSSDVCATPNTNYSNIIKIQVSTGIRTLAGNGGLELVPNPNKGEFTISGPLTSASDQPVNIVVTNMLGQTVYSNTVISHNGNLNEHITLQSTIANGTYLVKVMSGEDHCVFHLVVEK
jgi:Zn-dependent metalloprotease